MSETVESIIARAFDPTAAANTDPADRWAEDWKQLRVIASFKAAQALVALDAAGYAVVPKEPTVAMFTALTSSWPKDEVSKIMTGKWLIGSFAEDYASMLAAYSGETPK